MNLRIKKEKEKYCALQNKKKKISKIESTCFKNARKKVLGG